MRAVIFDIDHTIFAGDDLHAGVADLLAILKRLGIKVGAISGNDHRALVRLNEAGISPYFHSMLCSSHIDYPKAPGGLRHLIEKLGVEPQHVVLVSHANADILLAKDTGLGKAVGVTHGSDSTLLHEAGADHLVDDIPSVLDVVG